MAEQYTSTPARRLLGFLTLVVPTGLTIYWASTYTGLFSFFAELQLRFIGLYGTEITFLLTLLVLMAPFLAALKLFNKVGLQAPPNDAPSSDASGTKSPATADLALRYFLARYGMSITLGCVAVVFFALAGRDLYRATRAGSQAQVDVQQFEQGRGADNTWITLRGQKLMERSQAIEKSYSTTEYIPVVSAHWKEGSPVAAFIEVAAGNADDDLKNENIDRHSGMISSDGLPGMVRVAFEQHGLPPAPNYIVLEYGRNPADIRKGARDMIAIASIMAGIALSVLIFNLIRQRPAAAPTSTAKQYVIKNMVGAGDNAPDEDAPPRDDVAS